MWGDSKHADSELSAIPLSKLVSNGWLALETVIVLLATGRVDQAQRYQDEELSPVRPWLFLQRHIGNIPEGHPIEIDRAGKILLAAHGRGDIKLAGKPFGAGDRVTIPHDVALGGQILDCDGRGLGIVQTIKLAKTIEIDTLATGYLDVVVSADDTLTLWKQVSDKESADDGTAASGPAPTIAAETRCQKWLVEMMLKEGEIQPKRRKEDCRKEAISQFGIGGRAFNRAWEKTIEETGATTWSAPGALKKSRSA